MTRVVVITKQAFDENRHVIAEAMDRVSNYSWLDGTFTITVCPAPEEESIETSTGNEECYLHVSFER